MTHHDLPSGIEVYEIGARRLYVKSGVRNIAISENDLTPQELVGIARDIAARQAERSEPQVETAGLQDAVETRRATHGFLPVQRC